MTGKTGKRRMAVKGVSRVRFPFEVSSNDAGRKTQSKFIANLRLSISVNQPSYLDRIACQSCGRATRATRPGRGPHSSSGIHLAALARETKKNHSPIRSSGAHTQDALLLRVLFEGCSDVERRRVLQHFANDGRLSISQLRHSNNRRPRLEMR